MIYNLSDQILSFVFIFYPGTIGGNLYCWNVRVKCGLKYSGTWSDV